MNKKKLYLFAYLFESALVQFVSIF